MLITEQDAVAMGDQRSAPIGAAQGIKGYCGLAGTPYTFTAQ
jgi:hypothetical protein